MVRIELYIKGYLYETVNINVPAYPKLNFEYRTKAREKYLNKKIEELKSDMDYEPDVVVYFMSACKVAVRKGLLSVIEFKNIKYGTNEHKS